jgi:serine/threonine protein kinase
MRDVGSALKFIHGENICHNDVNDSNIMLVPDEGKKWRAILIDFSIASPQYQKMTGFHGTAPFVHRDVHENYHWLPVAEYDKTSLGFALVVMLERGVVPWKGLNSKGSKIQTGEGASLYDNRVVQATAALGAHKGLCGDAAARIKTLFELDKETFIPKACECSQNCGNKKCSCHQQGRSCSVLCKCHEKCCNPNDCQNPNDCRNPFTSASSTPLKFDNNLFTDLVIFPKKNKSKSRLGPDV